MNFLKMFESMLNDVKRRVLVEDSPPSYAQRFRDWCKSKGLQIDMGNGYLTITQDGKDTLSKKTNSFSRSAHLDSFANQISKKLGIENDFSPTQPKTQKIGDVLDRYKSRFIVAIADMRDHATIAKGFGANEIKNYLIQVVTDEFE